MSVASGIEDVFRDALGVEPPDPDVDLIDSGLLDSLMIVTLLLELERAFGVTIALGDLDLQEIRTVSRLRALVERRLQPEPGPVVSHPLLTLLRAGTGGPPVFLVPGARGIPASLLPLVNALQTPRPIYGFAHAALDDGVSEPRIEDLADAYAGVIGSLELASSGAFVGASLGGLLALETARRLPAVEQVVLMDTRLALRALPPRQYWTFRLTQPLRVVRWALPDLRRRLPDALHRARERLVAWVRSGMRSGNVIAADHGRWPQITNHAGVIYRPEVYTGRVTLFVTEDFPLSTVDPVRAWRECLRGEVSVEQVSGHHADFLHATRLSGVAEKLDRLLLDVGAPYLAYHAPKAV